MPELAMVNGVVTPLDQAVVSIDDRGLLFGDAVYEVIAAYDCRPFLMDGHMRRLKRSLREMQMLELIDMRSIGVQVRRLLRVSQLKHAKIYLQISRGVAPRAHQYPEHPLPNVILTARELHRLPEAQFRTGVKVISVSDERWARCDIKTVCLLGNVRAKQAAVQAGVFDALLLAPDNVVREATAANAFMVADNTLYTHPIQHCILGGITRDHLIKLARKNGIRVEQRRMTIEQFRAADEVFLSGTTTEVLPVIAIDGQRVGNGRRGPLTARMYELLGQSMQRARGRAE